MPIVKILKPRLHDLGGGMMVRRILPALEQRSVGPFVFLDHFGPLEVKPENNFDVRPHPHIGLATVTYLFEGAMIHRDSMGYVQRIEPGAINWMTAGRGVVHSERRPEDLRQRVHTNHGLQLWAAMPAKDEEVEPAFFHTPARDIPTWEEGGLTVRVLIGQAFGLTSPVSTYAETLYMDVCASRGRTLELAPTQDELGIYSVDNVLTIDDVQVEPGTLAVLVSDAPANVTAPNGARYVVIGGDPIDGYRHMWWNFVSSRKERIEQAKSDYLARRMGVISGDSEWMPLPN
jgi:redox-sensitive bicupin YhaK (pirin superfamily)